MVGSVSVPRIVVGIDGTAESRLALSWAVAAASGRQATVRVVRAYLDRIGRWPMDGTCEQIYQAELDEAVAFVDERLGAGRAEGRLVHGSAAKALLEAAVAADLIALGTRSGPDWAGFAGSTLVAVADGARCPVVAVRSQNWSDPILVGTDCSATCEPAVAFAFGQAEYTGLPLTVAYCWQALHDHDDASAVATKRAMLAQWVAGRIRPHREQHPGVSVRVQVVTGRAIAALAALAPEYSLMVLGSHSREGDAPLTESVSASLLQHAACSVVVTPRQATMSGC